MKILLIMATLAVDTEMAIVGVVTTVATIAVAGELNLIHHLFTVTRLTLQPLVGLFEFELCFIVVKLPELPAVGVMALATLLAQSPLVFILVTL